MPGGSLETMIGAGSDLVASFTPRHKYRDPQFAGSAEEYAAACARSNTVYVGNLSFHTTEEQVRSPLLLLGGVCLF